MSMLNTNFDARPPELLIESLLGVTHQDLENTIRRCFEAYISAGPLKPQGAGGTLAWMDGIETIRRQLIAKGWTPEDKNNQPRVVSPDGKHAITVMYGNQNTSNPHTPPKTRNKKGNQTSRSIHYNARQADLFPLGTEHLHRFQRRNENEQTLWVLLFCVDRETRTVQYELSRPTNMTESGKVDGWAPRFIMPPVHVDQPGHNRPDLSPDIDIPVTERS